MLPQPPNDGHSDAARPLRVVVTGGSTGIGRSIVEVFANAGHRVLFTYLRSVQASIELEHRWRHLVVKTQLDQGDVASVATFAHTVADWSGPDGVDILVNNAALGSATVRGYVSSLHSAASDARADTFASNGATSAVPLAAPKRVAPNGAQMNGSHGADKPYDAMRKAEEDAALMRVNALGPLWVTEAAEPSLRRAVQRVGGRGRACIMFIGSVGGGSAAVFPEYRPADLMSKAAMTYLVKHLAAQYVHDALDVVCVSPGATETEMFQKSTLSKVRDVRAFVDSMPKRQLIQPREVADVVLWLATNPAARIFHGAVLDASLGLAVRPGLQTESANSR